MDCGETIKSSWGIFQFDSLEQRFLRKKNKENLAFDPFVYQVQR